MILEDSETKSESVTFKELILYWLRPYFLVLLLGAKSFCFLFDNRLEVWLLLEDGILELTLFDFIRLNEELLLVTVNAEAV